jgi:hypothetical protein
MARQRRPPATSYPGSGSASPPAEQVVERALNQTRPGYDEHNLRVRRFDAAYDIWRGNAGTTPIRQTNDWQSRMRVKIGMQMVDQALVNLVQGVPKARVTARQPQYETQADGMEALLGYYADLDHIAERESVIVQQALIYGLSPAKVRWYYCEEEQTQYLPATDPDTGQIIGWQPQRGQVVTDDRPTLEPWDAYSVWWDPLSRGVQEANYLVLRTWLSRDELERDRYNDVDGTGRWRNLDMLYQSGSAPQPTLTAQQRMFIQPQGTYIGRYEIWEIWRKTPAGIRLTVVGNRKVLLSDGPSPYWMNEYPIVISNTRPDLFRMEGVSETELIDHIQQAFWTVHNLRMEQLKGTVMRPMSIRSTVPNIDEIVYRPNARWQVNDHDDIQFHAMPPLPPEAYKEQEELLSLGQYVTGITPYVGGATGTTTGVDQSTATGVSLLTQSASLLLKFKAGQIHQRTWQRTFEMWAMLTKQFVRQPQYVKITGDDGQQQWVRLGPADINGDFDIRIDAGDEAAGKAQERSDAVAILQALFPYVQVGAVDPKELIIRVGKAFGIEDPNGLLAQPQQPPPAAAPNGPQQQPQGPPPQLPPNVLQLGTGLAGAPVMAPHPPASLLAGNQGR